MERSKKVFPLFIFVAVLMAAMLYFYNGTHVSASSITLPTPTPTPTGNASTDDDEPIKIETELVNLDVRVVDRSNRPINNLTEKDFTVLEDGVKQSIEFFSKSEVPTNYSIVVDTSKSLKNQFEKVIEAGKIMVAANRPADETSLIRFVSSDKISVDQPFTTDKSELNDALDALFMDGGQTAVIDAVYLAVDNVQQYKPPKSQNDRNRRAIVLVTDGEDRNSYYNEKQLYDLLRESDVQIYVIGFVDDLSKEGGFISKSTQSKAKSFLQRMATETGGKAYFPSTVEELPNIARDISNEMRTQYSIGYSPSDKRDNGTFRAIKVLIADGPKAEKRIAVTRTGRNADGATPQQLSPKPTLSPTPSN